MRPAAPLTTEKNKGFVMTTLARLHRLAGPMLRASLLLAALSVPVFAMPAIGGAESGIIVGDMHHPSGAGLVIVAGLQRAR